MLEHGVKQAFSVHHTFNGEGGTVGGEATWERVSPTTIKFQAGEGWYPEHSDLGWLYDKQVFVARGRTYCLRIKVLKTHEIAEIVKFELFEGEDAVPVRRPVNAPRAKLSERLIWSKDGTKIYHRTLKIEVVAAEAQGLSTRVQIHPRDAALRGRIAKVHRQYTSSKDLVYCNALQDIAWVMGLPEYIATIAAQASDSKLIAEFMYARDGIPPEMVVVWSAGSVWMLRFFVFGVVGWVSSYWWGEGLWVAGACLGGVVLTGIGASFNARSNPKASTFEDSPDGY
jgi:hypothetical protein